MIYELLFERPFALFALWAGVQTLLLGRWWRRRGRRAARAVWVGLVAIPALMTISIVVVTPRERVIAICRELAGYVDDGDVLGIAGHVAGDFEANGFDRAALLEGVERALARVRVDSPRLRRFEVTFPDQGTGLATFNVTCRVRSVDFQHDLLASRWRITFHGRGAVWRVASIESLPVSPLNFRRLSEWLR